MCQKAKWFDTPHDYTIIETIYYGSGYYMAERRIKYRLEDYRAFSIISKSCLIIFGCNISPE